jgi:hypothetical protein
MPNQVQDIVQLAGLEIHHIKPDRDRYKFSKPILALHLFDTRQGRSATSTHSLIRMSDI